MLKAFWRKIAFGTSPIRLLIICSLNFPILLFAEPSLVHDMKPISALHLKDITEGKFPNALDPNTPLVLYLEGDMNKDGNCKISIPLLNADIPVSCMFLSTSSCNVFEIQSDLIKTGKTALPTTLGNANFSIVSGNLNDPLEVKILGAAILRGMDGNRTSLVSFGGNDASGVFDLKRALKSFYAKNIRIRNQIVCFATIPGGPSASISEDVKFEEPVNGRHGVLVLNCDNGAMISCQSQTIRVGALAGEVGNGIVTTRTGRQNWAEIDPLSEEGESATPLQLMGRTLAGDNAVRDGILEIFSDAASSKATFAEFSGEIRDNLSDEHARGRVNLVMNSSNHTQVLSGKNSFTGYVKLQNGILKMNVADYSGNVIINGGMLQVISPDPVLNNLDWSSGGFVVDLKKHSPISLEGSVNISTMPQAADAFIFENIVPGEYILFTHHSDAMPFRSFANQTIDYVWAGKTYLGRFLADSNSLKITFSEK